MKAAEKLIEAWQHLASRLQRKALHCPDPDEEAPLRAELFSADQMEQHGKALAASHTTAQGQAPDRLLSRLDENERVLVDVCKLLTTAVLENRRITPAGVWLLDNFYLIEEQIRTARRHLPKGYSRELPRLKPSGDEKPGLSAGHPRVYDIALEIISHGDGRIDKDSLIRFVTAYQCVTPLKLGELWAIPIMLRLAVIENLRRVGIRIAAGRAERNLADTWADTMSTTAEEDPKSLILVIADMARSNPPMVGAFVAELARRLQGRGPALALPLTWIEQRLGETGQTIEQLVQQENQQQAADQISVSNSIGSLRVLGAMDWRDFVESMSLVEKALLEDPGGVYGQMDFATRDHYRHATETLAKHSGRPEEEVARAAISLALASATIDRERTGHVGFYLIGKGLPLLESSLKARLSRTTSLRRSLRRHALWLYLGNIAMMTVAIAAFLLILARIDWAMYWLLIPVSMLTLLAGSHLAVALTNWLCTLLATPQALPKMDFSSGIPPQSRTLVVVPTMLTSPSGIEALVEALEVRFLANRDERLHFALLTDLCDAQQESLPADQALEALARTRIDDLNRKYGGVGDQTRDNIFFLFHRARRWNPQESVWMGYERKRGKLADLNALLRDRCAKDRFSVVVGDIHVLSDVKYVITLDTDTQLPRDSARKFVGAMAHPLNRPCYDEEKQMVVDGYGILQPRVAISLPGTNRSHYARLYGGEPGIDPYTRAISDVYQDVFGEGSFIGKGIYDVDAFERALGGRFPENRILSHDLIEGCHARAGLLSDVQLFEDYPARYSADVSRRYRWIRGDWQLAGWLLRRTPCGSASNASAHRENPLSALSQWKLIDNLRRSLVPAAWVLLLISGWMFLAQPGFWTGAILSIMLIPSLCSTALDLFRKPDEVMLRQHLASLFSSTSRHIRQLSFELACLPFEAFFSLGAITRTVWRMLVTHKRMLEWNPSGEAASALEKNGRNQLAFAFRSMWIAPVIAATTAGFVAYIAPVALAIAAPILLLWLASPAIAWWVSLPLSPRKAILSGKQTQFLRMISRRTWAFFDELVGPEDHWLPPDNFQSYRATAIAHRTSPTNIGLALLANLSAYDFGYLSAGKLIERTAQTLKTMTGLERYRKHFFNWYDTQSLEPLSPRYVSTVDSGNLAGHLMTLRPGLLALIDAPILNPRLLEGLSDTLSVLLETLGGIAPKQATIFQETLALGTTTPRSSLLAAHTDLSRLAAISARLSTEIAGRLELADETPGTKGEQELEVRAWLQALAWQCNDALDELALLAPWLLTPGSTSELKGELAELARHDAIPSLRALSRAGCNEASTRIARIESLARQCGELSCMDYDFLFDSTRHLLSIGYNVSERRADVSFYDLLASEARLCSFVAIAQDQLPQESWFALGRLLTGTGGEPVLLSWSGSMFEYLMPLLVMPTYDNTLLDQTCKAAVARQIDYGKQRGVPWGISESAFNTVDVNLNYQYRAFGVPGLGLKRGLAEDLVIAPYASTLALMVAPEAACLNLQRLAGDRMVGKFGFFEAIDYTSSRQRRGQSSTVIHAFMAHHQGMSLLALAYLLLDRPMQRRFESDRLFQAVMLLLQERIPKAVALFAQTVDLADARSTPAATESPIRVFDTPDTAAPEVQLLSNGRYHVMLTNAGGGFSRWKDLAVTRWREDGTCDNRGSFCYLRDLRSGSFWSAAHQPTLKQAEHYEAIFSEGRAEFRRRDVIEDPDMVVAGKFETHTEIVVSPEDDIELRRIRITNRSRQRRQIEVTSYAETVIALPAADALHPAFSNLFVQTEIVRERRAILSTRRPRSLDEQAPWMLHLMAVHGADASDTSYETDRLRFIGRGRSPVAPLAMIDAGKLSDTDGSVLDPVAAIRTLIMLDPEKSVTIDIVSGMAETREIALALIGKYQDRHLSDRVIDLAWTHSQVVLRQLNASEAEAQLYARLASAILYANADLRADAALVIRNRRGQSGLWGYAISGDLPIVLLQIGDAANIDLVRQLVQAHAYWRLKGLAVDLVIWNEDHAGYRQQLQGQIMDLIASGIEASVIDRPGGIFVRPADQISGEDRILIQSVARAIINDSMGSLEEQLDEQGATEPRIALFKPLRLQYPTPTPVEPPVRNDLILFNGIGGFTSDGREYVITLAPGQTTPAPWVNVIANPQFGTIVSENGAAYSWNENAHEYRLTPWHNDPVSDSGGEAIYLRDEESGRFWSPTPFPAGASASHVIRHGFGYSVFESRSEGLCTELWVYVAIDAAIKFSVLKIRNESGRPRKLSATCYVEWILGDLAEKSAMHVSTEVDTKNGALYARNPYNTEFPERVAFLDVDETARRVSGNRREFIGRNGTLQNPAAMKRSRLSGRVGATLDPCGAIQVNFDLADGHSREIVFRLGAGRTTEDASQLVQRFRGESSARDALQAVWQHWNHVLGAVQVDTPDPSVNVLTNGWLVYQTLACRLWARSGYYQSGGAFGFRDQLQDAMALVHARPGILREHILLCASRQFLEGDVQHWWHPPSGRGVRTHCSDDYLWLPLAVCRYVSCTGDTGILDETVRFLEGRPVNPGDDSYYDLPGQSGEVDTLYAHCVRAIRHSLRFGKHGIPLIGSGDWNDGMNRVGIGGKGESVWLGFFLYEVLTRFSVLAQSHNDTPFADLCTDEALHLRKRIEKTAWDGQWYRRAFFDDGTPLGSENNEECQIDSISQSWSVLSGAGNSKRTHMAMNSVYDRLVRLEDGIVQLLDPPFDKSQVDPGYIRGYVPGVRENGGQYTHGAIWTAMAFAALGDSERAWNVLNLINPVRHGLSVEDIATYKVEPYVVSADVYALAPHTGRGGWSWYTGSAGWMYRLILESLLGLKLENDRLFITPCLPADWDGFKIHYRYRETVYHIAVAQQPHDTHQKTSVLLDGIEQHNAWILLVDDHQEHNVDIRSTPATSQH